MAYPDYVKKYKPKGTVVKKVRDVYYVYKATSKRVPDKSYPVQVIQGLIGKIDEHGFQKLSNTLVNQESVIVLEAGFTNYLLLFEDNYILNSAIGRRLDRKVIFRSIIAFLSPNSYLISESKGYIHPIPELEKQFDFSICRQLNVILKIIQEKSFARLEPLKYICRVKMGEKLFSSTLNDSQKALLSLLGVNENGIK